MSFEMGVWKRKKDSIVEDSSLKVVIMDGYLLVSFPLPTQV